jgi:glycerate 2-kinase
MFSTATLKNYPYGEAVTRILASAFNAVEPGAAVKRYLRENPLPANKRVFAFALGKAACAMVDALADSIQLNDALVITKHASPLTFLTATVIEGDHPIPGDSSLAAGRAALEFVSGLAPDDLLICLISGGGSALMTAPVLPLVELQSLTSSLLAGGARIDEINTVRRHLDRLKGGGLAQAANGAQIISLILSDVVGDSIEAIASGPTAPDPSTREDAIAILHKFKLEDKFEKNLRETAKPDHDVFKRVQNHIIAGNQSALQAAQIQAGQEGFSTKIITDRLQGEAREVGGEIAILLKEELHERERPFCLLAGGETTVTIKGNGKGGRNQELALGAVEALKEMKDVMLLSIATDGEDGPTDAAGAVATNGSAQRAAQLGIDAAGHLSRNDAYAFFEKLGDLIKTGPSGTNVNDLVLCIALQMSDLFNDPEM